MQSFDMPTVFQQRKTDLQEKVPEASNGKYFNILCVGKPGQGKSAFIATALATFDPSHSLTVDGKPMVVVGSASTHTQVSNFFQLKGCKIRLRDAWGVRQDSDKSNLTPDSLECLLDGTVPNGVTEPTNGTAIKVNPETGGAIDAVIIFLPPRDYPQDNTALQLEWQFLKPLVDKCAEKQKKVIFVVNRLDTLPDVTGYGTVSLQDLLMKERWLELSGSVMRVIGVAPLPCLSLQAQFLYPYKPTARTELIEDYVLNVLEAALSSSAGTILKPRFKTNYFVNEDLNRIARLPSLQPPVSPRNIISDDSGI